MFEPDTKQLRKFLAPDSKSLKQHEPNPKQLRKHLAPKKS